MPQRLRAQAGVAASASVCSTSRREARTRLASVSGKVILGGLVSAVLRGRRTRSTQGTVHVSARLGAAPAPDGPVFGKTPTTAARCVGQAKQVFHQADGAPQAKPILRETGACRMDR